MIQRSSRGLQPAAIFSLLLACGLVAGFLYQWVTPLHLVWTLKPGFNYTFRVRYGGSGQARVESLTAGNSNSNHWQAIASQVEGRLDIAALETGPSGARLLFHLSQVTGETSGAAMVSEQAQEVIFSATMSPRGYLSELRFDPGMAPLVRNQTRAWLSQFQVTMPQQASWRWRNEEADLHGRFRAEYTAEHTFKAVRPFRKVTAPDAPIAGVAHRRATWEGTFDSSAGHPICMEGQGTVSVHLGHIPLGEERTTFALAFVAEHALHGAALAEGKLTYSKLQVLGFRATLEGTEEQRALAAARDADLAQSLSLPAALADLALPQHATAEGQLPAFLRLKALLRTHPEKAQGCAEALATLNPDGLSFGSVASALASVGHREAQTALRDAARSLKGRSHALFRLVPYLGLVAHPSLETETLARDIAHSRTDEAVERAAFLALGNMGNSLRSDPSSRAAALFEEVRAALNQSARPDTQRFYLRVLGNLGHASQASLVTAYLRDPSAEMREAAVDSLRFVNTPLSETILRHHALHDASDKVRSRSVEAMGYSEMSRARLNIYKEVLRHERAVPVVQEVLRGLGRAAPNQPEVLAVLRNYLQTCGHPDLCAVAWGEIQTNST